MKSIFSIALLGALAMDKLAAAAFGNVCSDVSVTGGGNFTPLLVATCTIRGKGAQKSKLNLNNCYGFQSGSIVYQDGGNLQSSCQSCSNNGQTLTCSCKNSSGGYSDVSHNLDSGTEVQDSNGFLKCFSHIADPDHKEAKIFVS